MDRMGIGGDEMTFFRWGFCWKAKPAPHRSRCKCHGKLDCGHSTCHLFSSGLSVFSQIFRGKEVLLGDRGLVRDWDMSRVVGDSTNGATDLCSLSAVVNNPGKIKGSIECCTFTHILHTIAQRCNPNLLCVISHTVRHFNRPSRVTERAG